MTDLKSTWLIFIIKPIFQLCHNKATNCSITHPQISYDDIRKENFRIPSLTNVNIKAGFQFY